MVPKVLLNSISCYNLSMKNALTLTHLSFCYNDVTILDNISLEYQKSDFLAIIGPNGGGKSTLLKLMIGLLSPTSGQITLLDDTPERTNHRIAYVPQDTSANKDFPIKVLDVVLMGRLSKSKAFSTYSKEDKKVAYAMLEKVGMSGFENQKLHTLSGGQRQRVFVARALASEAEIIFLDEPTASIDTAGQLEIFTLLKQLNEEIGIVIISHDINVALNYATKVAYVHKTLYLHDVAKDAPTHAFYNPTTEHVCPIELIGATRCNHFHPKIKENS